MMWMDSRSRQQGKGGKLLTHHHTDSKLPLKIQSPYQSHIGTSVAVKNVQVSLTTSLTSISCNG